jgi:hypothetical protein
MFNLFSVNVMLPYLMFYSVIVFAVAASCMDLSQLSRASKLRGIWRSFKRKMIQKLHKL